MTTITFPKGPLPPEYFTADRSDVLLGVGVTFIALEAIAFGLRVAARKIRGTSLGWDDAFMIPALLCNLAFCTLCLLTLRYGVGKHTLALIKADPSWLTVQHRSVAILTLLALPITYLFAITFSKLAILSLFLRIFKLGIARYVSYIVGAAIILQCIVCTVVTIMQCNPVSLLWTSIVRPTCIDVTEFFRLSAIPNVTTDLIMLVMPLPQVWRLNASSRIKMGITITLLTASIGIISSVLRLVDFVRTDIFSDPLWYDVNLLAYTIAEPGTIFLAACLMTYRPLFKYVSTDSSFFRLWSSHRSDSKPKHQDKGANCGSGVQEGRMQLEAKKQAKGFDSILLSAVSRDTNTRTESTVDVPKADGSLNGAGHSPSSGDQSIV